MVFSSATFLMAFLPITLVLYFLTPSRAGKNVMLLALSLVFYAWGEPTYVVLMVASIVCNWAFGILIAKSGQTSMRRLWLVCDLVANLALLGFFKYQGFLAENINLLVGFELVRDLELPLPIGISFYTLQALSYIIDVYRNKIRYQPNILYLGMYIAMFPQLVAGPIVRYETIQDQILNRKETLPGFAAGLRLFCVGLAKKVLLANMVAILAASMLSQGGSHIGMVGAWAGLIAYTFQIYFDFSGYSDMAIGLGKMFGFSYLRNFNYPYTSRSATEFWRRWHMSLGTFFRDHIYIPLGGNRVSTRRWVLNIFVVWFLTGFWHGAAWNFILWGLFYGVLLILERNWINGFMAKRPGWLQHLYGIAVFMAGWLIFWIEDMGVFARYGAAMIGYYGLTGDSTFWELQAWNYLPVFAVCVAACLPTVPWLRMRLTCWLTGARPLSMGEFMARDIPNPKRSSVEGLCDFGLDEASVAALPAGKYRLYCLARVGVDLCLLVMLLVSIGFVISGSYNPFIYFRF